MELALEDRKSTAAARAGGACFSPGESLAQLVRLRSIAVVGQASAIGAGIALGVALPALQMAIVVVALLAFNAATSWRLRRGARVAGSEVAAALAVDLAAFVTLLMMSGGTANPFHLFFLLHAVLAVFLLSAMPAMAGLLLVLAGYAAARYLQQPLELIDGGPLPAHLADLGSVLAFVLTVLSTTWFVARLVAALQASQRLLLQAAEDAHRDEMIVRLGALAAGAAHELATPLTTIGLIAEEMQHLDDPASLRREAATLMAQVDASRRTLADLRAAARHAHAGSDASVPLDRYLERIVDRLRRLRPEMGLACRWDGSLPVPHILDDPALEQAILILLNNAADASPDNVDVAAQWGREKFELAVCDRGAGMPEGMADWTGRMFFTTKPPGRGTGLGLVLATNVAGERGGSLRFTRREGGGTRVGLTLPMANLQARRT